jgi:hypothetical protein
MRGPDIEQGVKIRGKTGVMHDKDSSRSGSYRCADRRRIHI